MRSKIEEVKAENNKGISNYRLELIQLMEQGDQVAKSPWSSWQFGAKYSYNKWNSSYKGKEDKAEKYSFEGRFARSLNNFERYISPLSTEKYATLASNNDYSSASSNARTGATTGYGIASVQPAQEPLVSIEVEARIRPKIVSVDIPDLGLRAPSLNAMNINSSDIASINTPNPTGPTKSTNVVSPNASPYTGFFFDGARNALTPFGTHTDMIANDWNYTLTTYSSNHRFVFFSGVSASDMQTALVGGYSPTDIRGGSQTGYFNNGNPAIRSNQNDSGRNFNTAYDGLVLVSSSNTVFNANSFAAETLSGTIGRTTNILYRKGGEGNYFSSDGALDIASSDFYVRGYYDGTNSAGESDINALNYGNGTTPQKNRGTIYLTDQDRANGTNGKNETSYADLGRGNAGGADGPIATRGTIAIHTLRNIIVKDSNAYLYGRAGFLTSETWRNGIVQFENVNVNVYNDQNSVFYIMPSSYGTIARYLEEGNYYPRVNNSNLFYIGALAGEANVNLVGTGNNVYLSTGISGARHIINSGVIKSEGASNIIYSGIGYTPDWSNTWYQDNGGTINYIDEAINNPSLSGDPLITATERPIQTVTRYIDYSLGTITRTPFYTSNKMKSLISLGTGGGSVNIYGDENVGIFFGSKMGGNNPKSWEAVHRTYEDKQGYTRSASYIGIYQGEIEFNATIGNALSSTTGATTQTSAGNISGNDATLVEGTVGIFSESGQRAGISPLRDLGVPNSKYTYDNGTNTYYSYEHLRSLEDDKIHSLEVGKTNIVFGPYSKDGYMFVAKKGTVMDVAKTGSSTVYIGNVSTSITDGANGLNTTEANASTGTVIAYSEGVWKQADHKLGSNPTYKAANDNKVAGSTAAQLEGLGSEINIHVPVYLASKEGIAYLAKDGGIVNAKSSTEAVNHSAIIGMTVNNGTVNITGDVKAVDKNTTAATNKFKNIAAYAKLEGKGTTGGTVNINGNVTISGMAGFALGSGTEVNLNGTSNLIQTGTNGALAALNGGTVNFKGGRIYQESKATTSNIVTAGTNTVDHSNSVPFYADDNSSNINFTGATAINMSDGLLFHGTASDYDGGTGASGAKYHGMNNVTVNLTGNNVTLALYQNATTNWTGGTSALDTIKNNMKLNALNVGNYDYRIYYKNGTFNIANNINLDNKNDLFNSKIGLSAELINIGNGVTISSTAGRGTSIASNTSATSNANTGYNNSGSVNITGGTVGNSTALATSYGQINNKGTISIDKGVGVYGINGSTLTNNNTINVTSSGVGMAAFASAGTLKNYGTDAKIDDGSLAANDKVLEVNNVGTLNVTGNGSIGIYAATNEINNTMLAATNGIVTNTGKISMTGDNAIGIVSNSGKGITINLGGTGSSDITVGKNGIGVYAGAGRDILNISNTGVEVKDGGIGIFSSNGTTINPSGSLELKYSGSSTASAAAMFYNNTATNNLNINLVNTSSAKGIAGIYATAGTLTNNATITDKSGKAYGIYSTGANIVNSGNIAVGNSGKGILSSSGDVTLNSGSSITIGSNEAIGVYTKGNGNTVTANNGANLTIGNGSFGFVNEGTGNKITSNISSQSLGENIVYIYSNDRTGRVNNNTVLTSTGSENYGLYSAGTVVNNADINFASGIGNVGIYSINGGSAINNSNRRITVGASDDSSVKIDRRFAIGMAAGYVGDRNISAYTGNITNNGIINVTGDYSIGMYGTGRGTTVTNSGDINLSASNTTGMYLDNGATGINNGNIRTVGTGLSNVIGVVVKDGATIENNGNIILDAKSAVGFVSKTNGEGSNPGRIINYGHFEITGTGSKRDVLPSEGTREIEKEMGGIKINTPSSSSTATITVNGQVVVPELVTTTSAEFKELQTSTIGMYIDTSSKRYTVPIVGLSNLSSVTNADLIIGTEATENTNSKYIKLGSNILNPYNQMILDNSQIEEWNIYSGGLTWIASVAQNQTDRTIENAYMAKVPYTHWAGRATTPVESTDTYNFLDGLEQRYTMNALASKEKALFNRLNNIGNNEEILLYQAFDEMMGHQYANVQQRVQSTGIILDKEFDHLRKDIATASKKSNKIKTFGTRGEYKTDTAGVIDYKYHAYGVAYVHENEDIKLGRGVGWYTGIVHNTFKFKDIGNSKEEMLQGKVGMYKSIPFDDNNSLNWTISGELSVGYNKMHRKFLVVDEIFNAKSKYYTYGVGIKNELGKEFRLSEEFSLRPYAAIKVEYGRIGKIKEKSGEVKLEVKQNDYFSAKPELGGELIYKHNFGMKALKTSLGVAYENELGRVANGKNKARVIDTTADWFNIRGEKEDRKGNVKTDLTIGVEGEILGVTANIGYDTKGENLRGGLGLRVIF